MQYEGSFGFVTRRIKKIIADFHVLELFMAKNMDLSKKKFHMSRAGAGAVERKICAKPTA
jgi:hypothetical protein